MTEDELRRWRQASETTERAIARARQTGDWDELDVVARLLEVDESPERTGAWETICEAVCRMRIR